MNKITVPGGTWGHKTLAEEAMIPCNSMQCTYLMLIRSHLHGLMACTTTTGTYKHYAGTIIVNNH